MTLGLLFIRMWEVNTANAVICYLYCIDSCIVVGLIIHISVERASMCCELVINLVLPLALVIFLISSDWKQNCILGHSSQQRVKELE